MLVALVSDIIGTIACMAAIAVSMYSIPDDISENATPF